MLNLLTSNSSSNLDLVDRQVKSSEIITGRDKHQNRQLIRQARKHKLEAVSTNKSNCCELLEGSSHFLFVDWLLSRAVPFTKLCSILHKSSCTNRQEKRQVKNNNCSISNKMRFKVTGIKDKKGVRHVSIKALN